MSDFWDTDRLLWLQEGWEGGGSPSQMAREAGVTRNVIIGKIYRLQAQGELSYRVTPGAERARRPQAPTQPRAARPAPARVATALTAPEPEFDPLVARSREDNTKRGCQWPYGDPVDPDFRYCGQPGYPYCPGHARKAHQPRVEKRRGGRWPVTQGSDDGLSDGAERGRDA